MTDWQPIETAPKDGTSILAWDGEAIVIIFWIVTDDDDDEVPGEEYWGIEAGACMEYGCEPTHWMPLPKPPLTDK